MKTKPSQSLIAAALVGALSLFNPPLFAAPATVTADEVKWGKWGQCNFSRS